MQAAASERGTLPGRCDGARAVRDTLRALGVYMDVFQHIPYERHGSIVADRCRDLHGNAVGVGRRAAGGLSEFDEQLHAARQGSGGHSMRPAAGSPAGWDGFIRRQPKR